MKKIIAFVLCLVTAATFLTGCGNKKISEPESTAPVAAEGENQESKTQTTAPSDSQSTESVANKDATTVYIKGLGNKYVDYNNRSFAVNGKVYTLGVNTLQDMIDDGVPFDEDDIANANNNLNRNYESSGFEIVLGKYYSAQVYVANYTDKNATMASCVLSKIYLPVDLEKEQNILQFAFPLTISEEELIKQAGEPTDRSEYKSDTSDYETHTLQYKVDAEKYLGNSGYTFEFLNGNLRYLRFDWKP